MWPPNPKEDLRGNPLGFLLGNPLVDQLESIFKSRNVDKIIRDAGIEALKLLRNDVKNGVI